MDSKRLAGMARAQPPTTETLAGALISNFNIVCSAGSSPKARVYV
jgi:hypothetical protein